jgi:hypothetical protein
MARTADRNLDERGGRGRGGRHIGGGRDHWHERQRLGRQHEAPLPGLVAPREQLLRPQIVPPRHLRDHYTRRQALGHDPRLRLGAPPPSPERAVDHLEPSDLADLRVNPTVKR